MSAEAAELGFVPDQAARQLVTHRAARHPPPGRESRPRPAGRRRRRGRAAGPPPRPDAVFAASDPVASGALQALREHGRRVPDDVAPVGFDDLASIAGTTDPPLTTVHQDVEEMGRRTVRPLFDRTRQVRSEVVPTRPVRRRSA